jgi:hypothetical protein
MTARKHDKNCNTDSLWGVLDSVLDVYAMALPCEPEVAGFAMMTALALGERLGLPDRVVHLMGQSAAAAAS